MKKIFMTITALIMTMGLSGATYKVNAQADESVYVESVENESVYSSESSTIDDSVYIEDTEEEVTSDKLNDETSVSDKPTIDDVLDFAEDMADEAGVGNKWRELFNNLKNAATLEQITISTVIDFVEILILAGYIIYKTIVNKKVIQISKYLATLNATESQNGTTLAAQTNALKEMSSSEKKVADIGERLDVRQKNIAEAQEYTNDALMQIVEGINFSPERKKAAIRALNKSNEALDGGKQDDSKAQ